MSPLPSFQLGVAVLSMAISLVARPAWACECFVLPLWQVVEEADVIIEAEILSASREEVAVSVTRSWKGDWAGKHTLKTLLTLQDQGCGVYFKHGERRLLFITAIRPPRFAAYDITGCEPHPILGTEEYRRLRTELRALIPPPKER